MGMTDNQYKGMLVDEREDWEEVQKLAENEGNKTIAEFAQKKIDKINEKLKFQQTISERDGKGVESYLSNKMIHLFCT